MGKSASISAVSAPSARLARIVRTVTRVPLMTGSPPHTPGSRIIRSVYSILFPMPPTVFSVAGDVAVIWSAAARRRFGTSRSDGRLLLAVSSNSWHARLRLQLTAKPSLPTPLFELRRTGRDKPKRRRAAALQITATACWIRPPVIWAHADGRGRDLTCQALSALAATGTIYW